MDKTTRSTMTDIIRMGTQRFFDKDFQFTRERNFSHNFIISPLGEINKVLGLSILSCNMIFQLNKV